jgi:uncharacterized protein involved in outer membrane biogenesis
MALVLKDGNLVLRDTSALYEGGRVEVGLRVDARPAEPTFAFELEAFNVNLTTLMSQVEPDTDFAGLLDLSIDLRTRGDTGPPFMSNLAGHAAAMLRDGTVVSKYASAFALSFLRVSVPEFRGGGKVAPVHCLLARFPIKDGVAAAEELHLEGQNITVSGTGEIDLAANRIDLRLTPRVHDPGLVSTAATVDIAGPLNNPKIRPVVSSLGRTALNGVIQNALRPGRAALGRLRRKATAEPDDPCDLIALRRAKGLEGDEVFDPDDPGR